MSSPVHPEVDAEAYIAGLEVFGMRLGLERMHLLLAALEHPQRGMAAVHVVGSNGKSSTARMTAAILAGEGRRVGTYLSPHIDEWRGRIEVDGATIGPGDFAAAIEAVRVAAGALDLPAGDAVTQFEVLTAAALWAFRATAVDCCVLEAGLGGRYDATNVLDDDAVVALTTISLEHTDVLGESEAQIAAEKLAVATRGSRRVVVGRLAPAAASAVAGELRRRQLRAVVLGAGLRTAWRDEGMAITTPRAAYADLRLAARGRFQRDNAAVAVAAAEMLLERPLSIGALRAALSRVEVAGRLEVVCERPLLVLDGAHNPAGVAALVESLPDLLGARRAVFVVGVLGDKDAGAMVGGLAPVCDRIVATAFNHPRASRPERLVELAGAIGLPAEAATDPRAAVRRAGALAGPDGAIVLCGSLYLLADVRPWLLQVRRELPVMLAAPAGGGRQGDSTKALP